MTQIYQIARDVYSDLLPAEKRWEAIIIFRQLVHIGRHWQLAPIDSCKSLNLGSNFINESVVLCESHFGARTIYGAAFTNMSGRSGSSGPRRIDPPISRLPVIRPQSARSTCACLSEQELLTLKQERAPSICQFASFITAADGGGARSTLSCSFTGSKISHHRIQEAYDCGNADVHHTSHKHSDSASSELSGCLMTDFRIQFFGWTIGTF
jgi:hypothetical protein